MPLYYFNVYNDDISIDPEGAFLADTHAARAYAVKAVRGLASHTVLSGHLTVSHRVEIVDAEQNPIESVRFDEAVEIRP